MSVEFPNLCKDCELGRIIHGHDVEMNTPNYEGQIPIGFTILPKIERNCVNFIDSLLKKRKKIVNIYGSCDKPELYTPKIIDQETE